jgi:hypothetical protein
MARLVRAIRLRPVRCRMARTSRAMTVKELRVSAKGRWYKFIFQHNGSSWSPFGNKLPKIDGLSLHRNGSTAPAHLRESACITFSSALKSLRWTNCRRLDRQRNFTQMKKGCTRIHADDPGPGSARGKPVKPGFPSHYDMMISDRQRVTHGTVPSTSSDHNKRTHRPTFKSPPQHTSTSAVSSARFSLAPTHARSTPRIARPRIPA